MKQNYSLAIILAILFFSVQSYGQQLIPINDSNNSSAERSGNNTPFINQELCGTDFFHNKKMIEDAQYRVRHEQTLESMERVSTQQRPMANGILQVPVVVHVMHKGESVGTGTNISDEDVKRGISYLNNYWRKATGSMGDGDGVDMKIEFVLAVQDENGNCTDGIDRVDMSSVAAYVSNGVNLSETDGIEDYDFGGGINSLKEYSIWDPTKYYNLWIVDEIDNKNCSSGGTFTAGYAYYASAHGQPYDGSVVLICSYLNESSSTWAHEMGHAFNLAHTFSGDDSDGDGEGDQCGDDGILDTPKHIRTSSITPSIYFDCENTTINDCDTTFNQITNPDTGFRRNSGTYQDHIHNYMDYTGCASEFTGGQRAVVNSALTGVRASYLRSPALTPSSLATVYFTSSASTACLGGDITFSDKSACTPNSYTNSGYDDTSFLWTIDNGVDAPFNSTVQNPTFTFDNPGIYDVTLAITNPQGTTSLTKAEHIVVSSGAMASCALTSNNVDGNYGIGVTKVLFNTINSTTSTFVPMDATNDFTCTSNTFMNLENAYDLNVNYTTSTTNTGSVFLEAWIDWDNSGTFDVNNSNGINEIVLTDNIESGKGYASVSITPPTTAVLNTLLRMRVVSEYKKSPNVCGNGTLQRADDYGVYVKAACEPPTAGIVNNSGTTVLTCEAPSISLTSTGGVSQIWNNNKGVTSNISITEPGTYTVTVTSLDGCTDTESIVITEDKPAPAVVITNNTGALILTCAVPSISVTASGGDTYSWDNGLGNNATVAITKPGTYTVTVTGTNSCTATESIVVTDEKTAALCSVSSLNNGNNYGCGVTKLSLNTINKTTTTFIPLNAMLDFRCSDNTLLKIGTEYDLDISYQSRTDGGHYLQVWIDWDDSGTFDTSNSGGVNEQVLMDNIELNTVGTPSVKVIPPASAVLNKLLTMRVITDHKQEPVLCGQGFVHRTDDYGITVEKTLGLDDFSNAKLKMYPNPVKDYLTVALENKTVIRAYEIYDLTGRKVKVISRTDKNTVEVSALPSGLYFLKVKTDTGEFTGKFIKE